MCSVGLAVLTPENLSTKALFMSLQYKCYTVLSPTLRGTPGALGSIPCLLYVCKESSITNKAAVWLDLGPGCSFVLGAPMGAPASWACPLPLPGRQQLCAPQKLRCSRARSCSPVTRSLAGAHIPFPRFESWPRPCPLAPIQLQQNGSSEPCAAFPVAFP